jgi:hypothetical protein
VKARRLLPSPLFTLGLLLPLLVSCEDPKIPDHGVVEEVTPLKGQGSDWVIVRYRDDLATRHRVAHGDCRVGDNYPTCAQS